MVRFFPTPEAMMHLHVAMFRDWTARMNKKNQQVFAVRDTTGWKSNPHFSRHTTSKPMWVAPTILAWQIFRGAQKKHLENPWKTRWIVDDHAKYWHWLELIINDHKWSWYVPWSNEGFGGHHTGHHTIMICIPRKINITILAIIVIIMINNNHNKTTTPGTV